ncbi:hypothetical protein FE257_012850 [Aspergillus nanangensis]|uniref:Uncharacterized protein n=1 Tax=Aspergillus nanangensis TaxID=2582783 RepID=A0AAD4GQI2_ASPNN|nr:hypothetical protein FE257_012850 [Aspergillus nanangensis]
MQAAHVTSWGSPPTPSTIAVLPPPSPQQIQLKILAVGIPPVVRLRAAGQHPSAAHAPLPYDPSIDGVGLDESTLSLYYISPLSAPLLATHANVARDALVPLDRATTNPITVAGLANPVSSSWMALRCRVSGGCQGRTVVIVGATSASGRAAAVVARALGAARVIGLSRNEETLAEVEGLDERVLLRVPFAMPEGMGPVHVVLDYVGGAVAAGLLSTAMVAPGEELQYVQVGGLAAHDGEHLLRLLAPGLISSKPVCIRGSGMGSFTHEDLRREMPGLMALIQRMERPFEIVTAPLSEVSSAWESEEAKSKRLVVVCRSE